MFSYDMTDSLRSVVSVSTGFRGSFLMLFRYGSEVPENYYGKCLSILFSPLVLPVEGEARG